MKNYQNIPKIGQTIQAGYAGLCVIRKIHRAGTVDVESPNGRWFRVTGLPFVISENQTKL